MSVYQNCSDLHSSMLPYSTMIVVVESFFVVVD